MKGFEIRINGRKRRFIAVDSKVTANFGVQWIASDISLDILFATGMRVRLDGKTKNPVIWQTRSLKPGDEITVRLLEDSSRTHPQPQGRMRRPQSRKS